MSPMELERLYSAALESYLRQRDEEALSAAYDLGRRAMLEGIGILDMTTAHRAAVATVGRCRPGTESSADAAATEDFLREALSPFEMTFRGYGAVLGELRALNAGLEDRVSQRTGELSARLKEREVLLQEIHHRVKNNLQVVSSLINMQMRRLSDAASRQALAECRNRVQAMALIHDKLYQASDYARVPFAEYAQRLAMDVLGASGASPARVSLELAFEDVPMTVDRAIPCGLILNELITNALKHGFPGDRRGTIGIALERIDGARLRLAVWDDGAGLPAGIDLRRSRSLGMHLVFMLAEQLDGVVEVRSERGTRFEVTFPEAAG